MDPPSLIGMAGGALAFLAWAAYDYLTRPTSTKG